MFRDLSVLFLTVIAVAVTASCIQNLTITPTTATVATGSTAKFTANFNESGSTSALSTSWILTQGNSSKSCAPGCGSLAVSSTNSTFTALYTAPAVVPTPSTVTLRFIATDLDNSTFATATITVIASSNALTVSPQNQTVIGGSTTTQQFTANQSGGSAATGITWALAQNGSSCLAEVCGSIGTATANPVTYTPPTTFSASGTVTLTATQASSSQSASTTITIQAATLQSLAVTPAGASIQVGQQQPYTATGTFNNGQQQTVTSGLNWNSTAPTIASIDSTGNASGLHVGTTQISATFTAGSIPSQSVMLTVTPAPAAAIPRYLLEFNGDSTISTYAVVPSTGQLRSVTYLPNNATPGVSIPTALNPNGKVLYTAQPTSSGPQFITYSVGAGGDLSQLLSSPIELANFAQLVADPQGRFLWVVDTTTGEILSYSIDPVTGLASGQVIAATVANLQIIAADPTGTYLFSEDSSGNVAAYTVTSGGTLVPLGTPPSTHPLGFGSDTMIVDPVGKYLYVMAASSINQLFGYTISSTGLTSMSGSPFAVSNNAGVDTQMVIDPTGSFLYAMDISSQTQPIDAFTIGTGGALTQLTETVQIPSSLPGAKQITVDPSGQYLFVAYGNAHEVWTYGITQSGANRGMLTPVNRIRLRSSNNFIGGQLLSSGTAAVTFTPQALYVTNTTSNNVTEFTIAPSTGALSTISGSPIATSARNPTGIATLPNGSFAYTADSGGGDIDTFSITNNDLSVLGSPDSTNAGVVWLTSDLSGSFLYAVNQSDSNVRQFSISGGTLSSTSTLTSTDANPVFITTDPTGQFVYTANAGAVSGLAGGSVDVYKIGLPSGALTEVGSGATTVAQTNWVAVDPSGRFLYATNSNANVVYEYVINASTGALTANSTSQSLPVGPSASAPNGATSLVVEPTGQFLYATNGVDHQIFAFHIDPIGGFLTEIQTSNPHSEVGDTDAMPIALAVDVSGQYLYCVNSGGNDVNVFKINLADGTLSPVGTVPVPTGGTSPAGIAVTGKLQ